MALPITIALPDSAVSDNSDLRAKTEKLFYISRIAAIFQVKEILVYHDPYLKPAQARREQRKITRILQYIECPQYLRKRLFPLSRDTAAVGILSPLAIPHHMKSREIKVNEIREAAIFLNQNQVVADVGGTELLEVIGWKKSLKDKTIRTTVRIIKVDNRYKAEVITKHPKNIYWGYSVHSSDSTLRKVLQNRSEFKIATSRSCEPYNSVKGKIETKNGILIAFGGPYNGIPKILKAEGKKVSDIFDVCVNVITKSGTRSLRLEEAMMITFSRILDL